MASLEIEDEHLQSLKHAAKSGDVEFLRNCVASNKSDDYYLTVFDYPLSNHFIDGVGNIFHIAAWFNREDFIREAIDNLLPLQILQQLIKTCIQGSGNPLHYAAGNGNVEIVRMFLNVFRTSSPESESKSESFRKPWLQKDDLGCTPCYCAIEYGYENCALEILKMDMELLSNMTTNDGRSILYEALLHGLTKIAIDILSFSPSFSASGALGLNALDAVTNCQERNWEDICRLLLKREPKVIEPIVEGGHLRLQGWAASGQLWPFTWLLSCNDIIPNIRMSLVTLLSQVQHQTGGNLLHYLASTSSTNEEDVVEIAKLLIDSYKLEKGTQNSNISEDLFPWLIEDIKRESPLLISIIKGHEKLAKYILLEDNNALIKSYYNALYFAIEKGRNEVAEIISDIIGKQEWSHLLTTCDQQVNALHVAPKCSKTLCERLLKQYPWLLKGVDKQGFTIAHMWVRIGEIWPFEYIIYSGEIDETWRNYFIKLTTVRDYNLDNPIHVAA